MQIKAIIAGLFATIPLSSKIIADIEAYETSLAADPALTSAVSILAAALPSSVIAELEYNPSAFLAEAATATPAYFTALPSDVQSFFSSVGVAEASIISKDLSAAAAPTGRVAKLMGGMAAAGAVGLALL